jgi:hypothetical protein
MTTWEMWNLLSPQDLALLQAETDVKTLLPGHVDDSLWSQKLRTRWSVRKLALRIEPMRGLPSAGRYDMGLPGEVVGVSRRGLQIYPPLRWAVERVMADQLSQELEMLEDQRFLFPTVSEYRPVEHDPLAYQVQMLRQLEQQVSAKVAAAQ